MTEIATITFRDLESAGEAITVVRSSNDRVNLCLSVASNGDLEVVLGSGGVVCGIYSVLSCHLFLAALRLS